MKNKKLTALSWKGVILSIIVLATFGFIAVKATLDYIYCKELQATVDKGIVVEAEIVALKHKSGGGHGSLYYIMYRYVDEDGIVYESYCGRGGGDYWEEEEARKLIGEKVEIYIGGLSKVGAQPLSWPESYGSKISVSTDIVSMSVFYSAIVLYIGAVIIYCLFFYDKLPIRKKKSDNAENSADVS